MNRFILTRLILITHVFVIVAVFSMHMTKRTKLFDKRNPHDKEFGRLIDSDNSHTQEFISSDWKSASHRFKTRLERMRRKCSTRPQGPVKNWKPNMQFLTDVPRRLLVCAVPKSGSTSWHRIVWTLRRKRMNESTDQKLYTNGDTIRNQGIAMHLSEADGNKLISKVPGDDDFEQNPPEGSSFRLILARHPFARFISGWNQKFMLSTNYWVGLVKLFPRLLNYKKTIDRNRVVAFEDFANFAANNPIDISSKDIHFIPATVTCRPCEYDYTYVLKAESVDADELWLKRRLGLEDVHVGRKGIPPGGSLVNDDLKGNIRKYMSMLSPETIKGLYEIYKEDFEFFGYTFNFTTLEAGGFD